MATTERDGGFPSIPAITVWQPWASLIAIGAKPYEFRRRLPPGFVIGRQIAIHAGARPVRRDEVLSLLYSLQLDTADAPGSGLVKDIALPFLDLVARNPMNAPLRCVVCLATLKAPLQPDEARALFAPDSDRTEHHNFAWPLRNIRRLEPPVPADGAQGFWPWRPDPAAIRFAEGIAHAA